MILYCNNCQYIVGIVLTVLLVNLVLCINCVLIINNNIVVVVARAILMFCCNDACNIEAPWFQQKWHSVSLLLVSSSQQSEFLIALKYEILIFILQKLNYT